MKTPGQGSVTKLRNGRFWVRAPEGLDRARKGLGTYATREEADGVLAGALAKLGKPVGGALQFMKFARDVFDQREGDGFRSVKKERSRLEHHLAKSPIAHLSIQEIHALQSAELVRWLNKRMAADKRGSRKIKRGTVQAIVTVASIVMNEAVARTLIPANPFAGVKIRKRADEDAEDVWTVLTIEEQKRFANCKSIPYEDRVLMRCALGSGIREGELHHNFLKDLHVGPKEKTPHLVVRYGSNGCAPKNGKTRTVYLFGDGLAAFREWLEIRKTFLRKPKGARHEVRPDIGLIFPTRTGCRRQQSKTFGNGWRDPSHPRATPSRLEDGEELGCWVDRLAHYYHLAEVQDRPGLHFHCLRHTCATSQLQGLWGRPWALEEVQEHLGHSSIAITQRYAHKTGARVSRAAAEANATGYALVTAGGPTPSSIAAISSDSEGSRESGLNRRPVLYENAGVSSVLGDLDEKDPPGNGARNQLTLVAELAASYRELMTKGQHAAALAVGASLAAVLAGE